MVPVAGVSFPGKLAADWGLTHRGDGLQERGILHLRCERGFVVVVAAVAGQILLTVPEETSHSYEAISEYSETAGEWGFVPVPKPVARDRSRTRARLNFPTIGAMAISNWEWVGESGVEWVYPVWVVRNFRP